MAIALADFNAAQTKFAREMARDLLVDWSHQTLTSSDGTFRLKEPRHEVYLEIARERKWVSKNELKVLGAGFTAASGMLKR